jgi:hypothetical protein
VLEYYNEERRDARERKFAISSEQRDAWSGPFLPLFRGTLHLGPTRVYSFISVLTAAVSSNGMEKKIQDQVLSDLLRVYRDDTSYTIPENHTLGIDATFRIIEIYSKLCGFDTVGPAVHSAADKAIDSFQRDWLKTEESSGRPLDKRFEDFLKGDVSKHVHLTRYCVSQYRVTSYKSIFA